MGYGLDSSGSVQRTVAGSCEPSNETLGFIKFWEFLDWLNNCCLLKKDSAPWVGCRRQTADTERSPSSDADSSTTGQETLQEC
jgi:hypothetical protein